MKEKIRKLKELITEFEEVNSFYIKITKELKKLERNYKAGMLNYENYKLGKQHLLGDESEQEFKQEQNLYLFTLSKKIEALTDNLIFDIYSNRWLKEEHPHYKVVETNVSLERPSIESIKKLVSEVGSSGKGRETSAVPKSEKILVLEHGTNKGRSHLKIPAKLIESTKKQEQAPLIKVERAKVAVPINHRNKNFLSNLLSVFGHKPNEERVLVRAETKKSQEVGSYKTTEKGKVQKQQIQHLTQGKVSTFENKPKLQKIDFGKMVKARKETFREQKPLTVKTISAGASVKKQENAERISPARLYKKEKYKVEEPIIIHPKRIVKSRVKPEEEKIPILIKKPKPEVKAYIKVKEIKSGEHVKFSFASSLSSFVKRLKRAKSKTLEPVVSNKTVVPVAVELVKENKAREVQLNPHLKEEVEDISRIVSKERVYRNYTTTTLAAVSNIMVKDISSKLIKAYPTFFKNFYHKLRSAEIPILSNTYINIMIFLIILSFMASSVVSFVIFIVLSHTLLVSLAKAFLVSTISALIVFLSFYYYPVSLMKERMTDLKKNLPFAIQQMAAISSADLPPLIIFKIVAKGEEYGEVSKELAKIVNYVELFGVDFLVAVKSTASITPDLFFKDFLEGMILTINSGEKLKGYFEQKAEEALSMYKLEIQKYNATVSTLSDIYTALLIAAPLLMIATLSLIQMLGGKIGGFGIGTLMALSTYVVIPVLNVLFILIVKVSQSNV